jgi:signal transduction histidine kinase
VTHLPAPPPASETGADQALLQRRIVESEERLKYVTEAALDIVWDIDLVKGTCWCSNGLRRFGYDFGDEYIPMETWLSKLHPDDRSANTPGLERTLADPAARYWAAAYRFLKADGHYVRFEDRCYILRDTDGKPVRMIGGSTDVTRRMEMEEQLLQSQRLDALGQLTGGIAHDFNNLLTVILGNAQLLQLELQDNEKLLQLTRNIDLAATRSAELTRQLLAFSRKQTLQPAPVDINALLVTLQEMLARTLGENILIELKPQANLWPALVDPGQLEVALLNLCINARDAMPHGGTVTLETSNVMLDDSFSDPHLDVIPGNYVRISICDSGSGIPPEVLDRVFEPFFTTKEQGKGTGLGLSMVFGFVKQSNGHINIYSEPGHGTTVRLYLPRSEAGGRTLQRQLPPQAVAGGNECVLLVEDNELVRQFARDLLQGLGYKVLSAANSAAAMALLQDQQEIQLLFTDVVLPGRSGVELARAAQALRPTLKVLFASGYTRDKMLHSGEVQPGMQLLAKPYGKLELATRIRELLDQTGPVR